MVEGVYSVPHIPFQRIECSQQVTTPASIVYLAGLAKVPYNQYCKQRGPQGNGIVVSSEGRVHFDLKMWENADYDGENDLKSENPSYIFLGFYPSFHISLENS